MISHSSRKPPSQSPAILALPLMPVQVRLIVVIDGVDVLLAAVGPTPSWRS